MTTKQRTGDVFTDRHLFDQSLADRDLRTTSRSAVMVESRLQAGKPVAEWNHLTHRGIIFTEAKVEDEKKDKGIVVGITEPVPAVVAEGVTGGVIEAVPPVPVPPKEEVKEVSEGMMPAAKALLEAIDQSTAIPL